MNDDPEKLAAFVESLRTARDLTVRLDQGTMVRLRGAMARTERDQPGLAYEPGEDDDESLRVALLALVDRGLTEGERDAGLRFDFMAGRVVPMTRGVRWRLRLRRAWHVLKVGW